MRTAVLLLVLASLAVPASSHARGPSAQEWADSLRHVTVNGAELTYLDLGRGAPVVLVHGSLCDYRAWLGQLEALSKDHRVIAYSRRYHFPNTGGGDGSDYSLALHEKDLAGLLDALHLDEVDLVGHSYGATLAAWFAARHPSRVRSLVLVEPSIPEVMAGAPQESLYASERQLMSAQTRMALRDGFPDLGVERVSDWAFGDRSLMTMPRFVKTWMVQNAAALRMQFLSEAPAPKLDPRTLSKLQCPVLYLQGDRSPWHAKAMAEAFVRCHPATRLRVMRRTGHGMMWDDARAFNRVVLEFLPQQRLAAQ